MSKSNALENEILALIFTNVAIADIGDAAGLQPSTTAGSLYIALHTAAPLESDNQTASEATYTGYARIAVARDGTNWTVTGDTATNALELLFGECTAGSETITHFSVGVAGSGATKILYISNALASPLAVSTGVTPRFDAGALTVTEG